VFKNLRATLNTPAYRLILATALRNWSLLAINLTTNLFSALLEGSTLGIIYLAVSVLSSGEGTQAPGVERALAALPVPEGYIFVGLLGAAVVLQTLLALSNYINKVSAGYLSARAQPQVTGRVFEQIMSFSFACASHYKVGDLVSFANSAAVTVNNQISALNNLVVSLSFTIVYSFILVSLSPFLALAAVLLALALIAVQQQLLPRLRTAARRLVHVQVELSKRMTENIQALRLLHTFGTQQRSTDEVLQSLKDVQAGLEKRAKLFYLPDPILEVLPILSLAILAALAYGSSSSQETLLPMLLTFLVALQRLAMRLRGVVGAFTQFADQSGSIERLNSILDPHNKVFALVGGEVFEALQADIVFENVSLSYSNDQSFALRDLNFTIPKNQVTAFVGQSGAGKSSIVDLLVGLYQPTAGQIKVNGNRLEHYNQSSWRQHIGVVSQDTFIFNASIIDNLRYGAPEATYEEVMQAAKAAQAHQFIMDLPDAYETTVGERGYRLSGGQRQRLALARAILKQPEILILDEATSALDSESERLIQQALAKFQQDRTVIVIAHRLSTIVEADQIIVLEKGQLVEQGSHRTLMQKQRRYAQYWNLQTQEAVAQTTAKS
jgi:ATP-binding cassette, subfamily B, bacterial MsbA